MTYEVVSVRPCGDGGWRVYIADHAGSNPPLRRHIPACDETEARRRAKAILRNVMDSWTVAEAIRGRIDEASDHVSSYTLKGYRNVARLLEPLSERYVDDLPEAEVFAFLRDLSSKYGPSMVKKARDLLWSSCRLACECGAAARNPVDGVKVPRSASRRPRNGRRCDIEPLLRFMSGEIPCVIALIWQSGLMLGEVCALSPSDVASTSVTVRGRAQRYIEGAAEIVVYETPRVVSTPRWVCEKLLSLDCGRKYLFSKTDQPGNVDCIGRRARWLLESLGFEGTLGELRRSNELGDGL